VSVSGVGSVNIIVFGFDLNAIDNGGFSFICDGRGEEGGKGEWGGRGEEGGSGEGVGRALLHAEGAQSVDGEGLNPTSGQLISPGLLEGGESGCVRAITCGK